MENTGSGCPERDGGLLGGISHRADIGTMKGAAPSETSLSATTERQACISMRLGLRGRSTKGGLHHGIVHPTGDHHALKSSASGAGGGMNSGISRAADDGPGDGSAGHVLRLALALRRSEILQLLFRHGVHHFLRRALELALRCFTTLRGKGSACCLLLGFRFCWHEISPFIRKTPNGGGGSWQTPPRLSLSDRDAGAAEWHGILRHEGLIPPTRRLSQILHEAAPTLLREA